MKLEGKVAIITAAGSGSGRAGVVIFAKEGAKVVAADIDPKGGEETVKMVKDAGGEAIFVQIDNSKVEDLKRMVETTVKTYGKLDILWNHAGIPGPAGLEETEEEGFDKVFAVNVKGPFFASKFAVPYMKKAGGGSIIFTGSIASVRGTWSPSYAATKGALVPLTMGIAVQFGSFNIRSNCICPGGIDTLMLNEFLDRSRTLSVDVLKQKKETFASKAPLGRLAKPEDIANAALFLASNDSAMITGHIMHVDGGLCATF